MSTEIPILPEAGASIGSDGRPHHHKGFSFLAVLEKCAAAERTIDPPKSLASAGERGIELHGILEDLVMQWVDNIEKNIPGSLEEAYAAQAHKGLYLKREIADLKSLKRVITEINPFFVPEPGMLVGTEERIDLHDVDGKMISFGWYDLFLKLGPVILIIDHKFVRKEVAGSETNRQGHAFAVSAWQAYPDAEDIIVLFTMPECGSSIHRFSRTTDELRLTQELSKIIDDSERPDKVLNAGDHCLYCRHKTRCPAAIGALKTMVTGINPIAVPESFAPINIKTPEDAALLRYWVSIVEPLIDEIKKVTTQWAMDRQTISCNVGGQHIEFKPASRRHPRKIGDTLAVWNHVKDWMPIEAFLQGAKLSIGDFETAASALLTARVLDEGKTPNAIEIAESVTKDLTAAGLVTQEEGASWFLKRVKASAKGGKKTLPEVAEGAE